MVRKGTGRKRIEIAKITKEANLQTTFSKRRSGLFKKANEISTLCGAEVALIVFSPSGKVFSFGHPNINVLLDRFSRRPHNYIPRRINNEELVENNTDSHIQDLSEMFTQVMAEKEIEMEKKKKYTSIINKRLTENPDNWFEKPPEELNLFQAIEMKQVVEDLKRKVDDLLSQTPPTHYVGSSSNVAPSGTFYDGNNQDFNAYDPNMVNRMMSFGYNANDNIFKRLVSDFVMNPSDHNQISNNEFKQGHPHY